MSYRLYYQHKLQNWYIALGQQRPINIDVYTSESTFSGCPVATQQRPPSERSQLTYIYI